MSAAEEALPLDWPEPAPALSPDQQRTERQRALVAKGIHPLTGGLVHDDADPAACAPGASRDQPFTCGSCRFRRSLRHHDTSFPKCTRDESRITNGPATDVRAWWPACRAYEARP